MKPIFLFPTDVEAHPFRQLCPEAEVVISGVGLAETSATLLRLVTERELCDEDCVVLCGIAGAYDRCLAKGSVVEVTEECCVELPERFQRRYHVDAQTQLCSVRSASVHRGGEYRSGYDIENMEGAALFALAEKIGVRCMEIRSVSNYVGEEFASWSVEKATEELAKTLKHIFDEY